MMGKRIWSLMLSVLLVMTMVPASVVTAFAEDAFTAATSPAAEDAVPVPQSDDPALVEKSGDPANPGAPANPSAPANPGGSNSPAAPAPEPDGPPAVPTPEESDDRLAFQSLEEGQEVQGGPGHSEVAFIRFNSNYDGGPEEVEWKIKRNTTLTFPNYNHKDVFKQDRDGYTFDGWKDRSTGIVYARGATLKIKNDTKHFDAQWVQQGYIRYYASIADMNQGSDTNHIRQIDGINAGDIHDLLTLEELGIAIPVGQQFAGWEVRDASSFDNETLGAEATSYSVRFNPPGDTRPPKVRIAPLWKAAPVTKPAITITAADAAVPYNGTLQSITPNVSGTLKPGHSIAGVTGGWGTDVDTYTLNLSGAYVKDEANSDVTGQYQLTKGSNATLTITPRPVTITARNSSKVFGAADPGFTFTVTPEGALVDPVHLGVISVSRSNSTVQAADTYTGVLVPSYTANANYAVTPVNGDFTIHEANAPAITVTGYQGIYDGQPRSVTVGGTRPGDKVEYKVGAEGSWTETPPSQINTTDVTVFIRVTRPNHYVFEGDVKLIITPRPVTITARNSSKVFGAADPGFTFTVTPEGALVDPVHLGTISVSRSNSTVQAADTYTGVLVPSYTPNSNYAVTPVNGDFTIHEANAPAITVTGYQGIYDGQPRSVTVGGTQPGDKVEYKVGAEGSWTETPPSQINTTDVTVFIRVTRPNHYVFEGDVKLIITPRPVTFIVGNAVKMYGTPDPTNISYYLALGSLRVVKGDDLKLKPLVKNADQNAGVHKEALDLSYDNPHGNYQIIVKPGTLTITRRPVIIIAHDSSKTHGAVDPTFNYTVIPKNALVDPADLGVISVSRSNSSVEAVGTYTGVLVPSYTANSNYVVIPVNGNFTITEGTVAAQLALGNYVGVYDGQPHGIAILDGVDAEKDQVLYSESPDGPWDPAPVTRTNKTDTPVTVYVQVTRAGYKARTGSATITITPRPVTFTVDDAVKMYGTPDPANLTYRLAIGSLAVVGGDNLNLEPFSMNWDQNVGNHEEVLGLSYNDPTGNYDITVNRGALTITPRPLTIATGSRSTTGGSTTRLTYNSWSITAGSVAEGDSLAVSVTGEQVGRGSSPNTATALITTTRLIPMRIAAEADVTANYAIQYSFGTLTISRPTGGGGGGDDGGGTTTIIDDPTPLGAGGTILILDGQVPLGALPKTGSQLGKAASRAGLASLVLGSLLHGLSKKKKNEQDQ